VVAESRYQVVLKITHSSFGENSSQDRFNTVIIDKVTYLMICNLGGTAILRPLAAAEGFFIAKKEALLKHMNRKMNHDRIQLRKG